MSFRWNEAREILARTPRVLNDLLSNLAPDWQGASERPDSWNPLEVVAHLIQAEREDWVPRARRILEHGTARAFDPFDPAAHLQWCHERSLPELLREFAALREDNLRTLDDIAPDAALLRREGTHPALGTVTLEQLLATWVVHDLNHLNQISRALAARYRDAVGAWNQRNFLRILNGD